METIVAARSAPARLVEYAAGRWIALPVPAALEVLEPTPIVEVPGALPGWSGLARWRERWLPVLDLGELVAAGAELPAATLRRLLVLGWRPAPDESVQYGALRLSAMPTTVQVSDAAQCALPGDSDWWPRIALSCFEHDGQAVPIVDPRRLFGD